MINQEQIADQLELLTTYRRTLAHLLQQAAQYGGEVFAPPPVVNGIHEARQHIRRIKTTLFGWGEIVEDHVDDEVTAPAQATTAGIQAQAISGEVRANADTALLARVVSDSGSWVLLSNRFFTSESVVEGSDGVIVLHLVAHRAEDEAFLRTLLTQRHAHRSLGYAYSNDAGFAQVQDIQYKSVAGKPIWMIALRRDRNAQGGIFNEVNINGVSADQIAHMRARLLLLNEQPTNGQGLQDKLLVSWIEGRHTQLSITESIFPKLWQRLHGQQETFLPLARLWGVFHLKASLTCEHILELTLGPIESGALEVRFRGQRHQLYTNQEPTIIEVTGKCDLN